MISRLFQIVYMLLERPVITAKELSERLEVSQRTIYRDLDKLSEAGIPVYTNKGRDGGISLLSDYVLDKSLLTSEEKMQILESLQALGAIGYEEESHALEKLQSFFGDKQQDWIEVDFSNWDNSDGEGELFQHLKHSILNHQYARFNYAGAKQENTSRTVKPLKLLFKAQAWYLYAYCELRHDYRFFKLHRITQMYLLEEHFAPEHYEKLIEKEYSQNTNTQSVTVIIKKEMAFRAYDDFYNLNVLENGDLTCTIEVRDMEWFIGDVLSYGPYIKVVEPENVKLQVKEQIKQMMDRYY